MTTILEQSRDALRRHLHDQMAEAIAQFEPEDILKSIQDSFLSKAEAVSNELAGIDTRWSGIELQSNGKIAKYLDPIVKEMVASHLAPIVESEVAKLLGQKTINGLIRNRIKSKVKEHICDLGGYKSAIREGLEQRVTQEFEAVIEEWVKSEPLIQSGI